MTCDEVLVACTESGILSARVWQIKEGGAVLHLCGYVIAYASFLVRLSIVPAINDNGFGSLIHGLDIASEIVEHLLRIAVDEVFVACVVDAYLGACLKKRPIEV